MSNPPDPRHPFPIEAITGAWRFVRPPEHASECSSTPGHLLHFIERGAYRVTVSGRARMVVKGDLIYYHQSERVRWESLGKRVVFYSVAFRAPHLLPPPPGKRILALTVLASDFRALHREHLAGGPRAAFLPYASLLRILYAIHRKAGETDPTVAQQAGWWAVENHIREKRLFRVSVAELLKTWPKSYASLNRECLKATGLPVSRRIRELRMEEAKGLLLHSELLVTELAVFLGYPTIHEFSREFSRATGKSPTRWAKRFRGGPG